MDVTAGAVGRLLESVFRRGWRSNTRVFQPVSSSVFGNRPGPWHEGTPLDPRSPYACAKAHAWHLCRYYRECRGVKVSCAVYFNHDSPRRRGEDYLLHKLCAGAVRIARGRQESIPLGDLDAEVDVGYAKEYAEAAWQTLQHDADDFVVGTGRALSVRDLLQAALDAAGANAEAGEVATRDSAFDRPRGGPRAPGAGRCDPEKARQVLGWNPKAGPFDVVGLLVNHYRQKAPVDVRR